MYSIVIVEPVCIYKSEHSKQNSPKTKQLCHLKIKKFCSYYKSDHSQARTNMFKSSAVMPILKINYIEINEVCGYWFLLQSLYCHEEGSL